MINRAAISVVFAGMGVEASNEFEDAMERLADLVTDMRRTRQAELFEECLPEVTQAQDAAAFAAERCGISWSDCQGVVRRALAAALGERYVECEELPLPA